MGFKYALLAMGMCALVAIVVAQDGDYFEDEQPKPAPPSRPSILNRRGIVPRGKPTSTTTTPPPPPKESAPAEEDSLGEEYADEEEEGQEEPTTTQASRKIKGGVVRPFRSNVDLLAALKRRRAEAANGKGHHSEASNSAPAETATESHSPPVKNNQGRRTFNQRTKSEPTPAPAEEATTASKNSRTRNRFSGRGLYKSPSNDNSEISSLETNQQSVEVKPRTPFKPGQRRF